MLLAKTASVIRIIISTLVPSLVITFLRMSDLPKLDLACTKIGRLALHLGEKEEKEEEEVKVVVLAAAAAAGKEVERLLSSSSKLAVNNAGNDHGRQKRERKRLGSGWEEVQWGGRGGG